MASGIALERQSAGKKHLTKHMAMGTHFEFKMRTASSMLSIGTTGRIGQKISLFRSNDGKQKQTVSYAEHESRTEWTLTPP